MGPNRDDLLTPEDGWAAVPMEMLGQSTAVLGDLGALGPDREIAG